MGFSSLLVVVIYLLTSKKSKPMGWLALLALASFTQAFVVNYNTYKISPHTTGINIEQISIYFYLVIEVTCCLLFISAYLKNNIVRRLLLLGNILFSICAIAYWRLHLSLHIYPWYITSSEGFLVITGSLCYFHELFSHKPNINLMQQPSFWAISGMLILFSTITPVFLAFNYLRKSDRSFADRLFAINNTSYILLFITFITTIALDRKQKNKPFINPVIVAE